MSKIVLVTESLSKLRQRFVKIFNRVTVSNIDIKTLSIHSVTVFLEPVDESEKNRLVLTIQIFVLLSKIRVFLDHLSVHAIFKDVPEAETIVVC